MYIAPSGRFGKFEDDAECRGWKTTIRKFSTVETCVVDPELGVESPKFCAACFEVEHVVHGCVLPDLGRMGTQVEQVCKSKQTHEPCVASDLAFPSGGKSVRDESLELESCVEGSCAAFELSSSPSGHRQAGCRLIELLTPVMLLAETKLWIAVIGLIPAVLAVVSCSCASVGKLGSCVMSAG